MPLHPKLVGLSSTRFDVDSGGPENREIFSEWIDIAIEAADEERIYGGENFAVKVTSLGWLVRQTVDDRAFWGHPHLIVSRWDISVVRRRIEELCESSVSHDWNTVVNRLARYLIVDTIDFDPA